MEPDRFVVIKDFNKIGSVVYACTKEDRLKFIGIANTLRDISKSPIQVVTLLGKDALDVYSEYKPYTFETDEEELIKMVISGEVPGTPNPFAKND